MIKNDVLQIIESQFNSIKYEYHLLIGECLRAIEFNNHILLSETSRFSNEEKQEIKKLNRILNDLYEKLIIFKDEFDE